MNEEEKNKYLSYITNNAKDETSEEKLKNILLSIVENRNKKSENFQKAFKTFKNDENYKFINPLIERHFFFKASQELNEKVIKDKEGYLVDFTDRIHEYFNDQTIFYWRINGCINEDEILGINFVSKDFLFPDQVIKQNTNENEKFIPWIEKLETNLPVLYIDMPCWH